MGKPVTNGSCARQQKPVTGSRGLLDASSIVGPGLDTLAAPDPAICDGNGTGQSGTE